MYLSIKPYKFINFASSKKVVPKPNPNSDYKREDVYINDKCQKSIYDNNNGDIFVINYDDSGKVMLDPIVSNYKDSDFKPNPAVNFIYDDED